MFCEPFFRLSMEGHITRSCLCTGLTEIRNGNIGNAKGRFYTGFFQLSIGIERLAKLALILDYMVDNQLSPPGKRYISYFGHDIDKLFSELRSVASKRKSSTLSAFNLEPLPNAILLFLSQFASKTRYANLDGLANGSSGKEPISEWNSILTEVLKKNMPQKRIDQISMQSASVANAMGELTLVTSFDLQNKPLTIEKWLTAPKLLDASAKYAVMEISKTLRPLIDLTNELAWNAREIDVTESPHRCRVPELREFFDFLPNDNKYILKKKRWP